MARTCKGGDGGGRRVDMPSNRVHASPLSSLEVGVVEAFRVLQVVQQAPRSGDEDVDPSLKLLGLDTTIGAAHDEAKRLPVVAHELFKLAEDLGQERRGCKIPRTTPPRHSNTPVARVRASA